MSWVGLGNTCNDEDMKLLYDSVNLTIGNSKTAMFW
jgi:hypothetical protein